ncbi:MAG: carbon-nitrogen hydrolase family protein [Candidatus Latescibacterota bacterium]|nr:carbon-nitrogen hydrolase family protein [Candidatus Latescibacterota bacterium]
MKSARLLSVAFPKNGYGSVAENRRMMVERLQQASGYKPDFVCFTEVVRELGVADDDEAWRGESIPGETTEQIGEWARQIGSYVIVGMQENVDGQPFNTAVLIGRDGAVIGRYHKVQPTVKEMARGTLPGATALTFDTDLARVGMLICFDLKFPEVSMSLARNGARIAFFPSMFHGGTRHQSIARDHGMFLVVCQAQESVIVDMCGRRLAWQGYNEPLVEKGELLPFACADVNLDCKAYHLDFNQAKLGDIQSQYGAGVRLEIMRPEATFVLSSLMGEISIEQIEAEFELEDLWTYYDRSREARGERLPRKVSAEVVA